MTTKRDPMMYKEFRFNYRGYYYSAYLGNSKKMQATVKINNEIKQIAGWGSSPVHTEALRLAQMWYDSGFYNSMPLDVFVNKVGK